MTEPLIYRLDADDVIRSDDGDLPFVEVPICLVSQMTASLEEAYDEEQEQAAFADGFPCRVLRPGQKQWLSGKVRFFLEFELDPDQVDESVSAETPDSSLDQLRKLAGE
ncbi:MAG: hypothetical protein EA001_07090 [Oscillatoriales cyanobacterium]|nr:MAG: hypothetical protein EA001_07090 [Oscillatoriales cyanobacterium]